MPIRYSGAPYVYSQLDTSAPTTSIPLYAAAFIAAGWTDVTLSWGVKNYGSSAGITFTGQPTAGQIITIDGQAYTARAARSVAGEFTIGATFAITTANLTAEINAVQADTLLAEQVGATGQIYIYDRRVYPHTFTLTENLANATCSAASGLTGHGLIVQSAKSPQGMQMRIRLLDSGSNITFTPTDVDDSAVGYTHNMSTSAGKVVEFIACKYQFWTWLMGVGEGTSNFQGGVPYVRDIHVAPVIHDVTNNGGVCQLETATPHGRITGDHVFIAACLGNPALNNWWQITVIDATHYTLNGSVYGTGYVQDSGRAAGPKQIARAYWMLGTANSSYTGFRTNMCGNQLPTSSCVNQYAWTLNGSSTVTHSLVTPRVQNDGSTALNFGGFADLLEARLAVRVASTSAGFSIIGELWNTFLAMSPMDPDVMKDGFNGFNWVNYSSGKAAIWIVRSEAV